MIRFIKSVSFAINGLRMAIIKGANFKIQLVVAIIVISLGVLLHISTNEWLICIVCIGFVLSLEMLNTAIEQLCDVVTKDIHPGIKVTKDIAAGAVVVAAAASAICGTIIFLPKIILFIKSISTS